MLSVDLIFDRGLEVSEGILTESQLKTCLASTQNDLILLV